MITTQENFKYIKLVKHQGNFFSIAGAPVVTGKNNYLELFFNFIDPTKVDELGIPEEEIPPGDELWTAYQKIDFPPKYVYAGSPLIKYSVASTGEGQPDTTVLNGADAPFEVLSDGQYIYIFRSTRSNQVYVDRFIFDNGTKKLQIKREVRFKRSQNKDVPKDQKDTLGPENLNGQAFIEPTTQLNFESEVLPGSFTVAIVPTSEFKSQECWQFFVLQEEEANQEEKAKTVVNAYSIPRSIDGLFDIREVIPEVTLPEMAASVSAAPNRFYYKVKPYDRFTIGLFGSKTCFKGLQFPSSLVYHCQEQIVDTYGNRQFVKRGARVLLSCVHPTVSLSQSTPTSKGKVAFLDFEIGKNGVPATLNADATLNNRLDITSISRSLGMALEFNGKDSRIVSQRSTLAIPDQSTIALWVLVFEQETPTEQGLLYSTTQPQNEDDQGIPFKLSLTEERLLKVGDKIYSQALIEGTWNYIALTVDRQESEAISLYINGELSTREDSNEQVDSDSEDDDNLVAGLLLGFNGFYGQMANLIIWDSILTEKMIGLSMHVEHVESGNQFMVWSMGEGAGSITGKDRLQNNEKGQIIGAKWVASNVPIVRNMPIVFADERSLNVRSNFLSNTEIFRVQSDGEEETTRRFVTTNTHAPVNLLESADGTIKAHFNQTDHINPDAAPRFYSMSLDTLVNRSAYQAFWETPSENKGELFFHSVTCTTDTNETGSFKFITILSEESDETDETEASMPKCTVIFELPSTSKSFPLKEVWINVPKEITLLNQVINGKAIDPTYTETDQEGVGHILEAHRVVTYDYTNNVKITGKEGAVYGPTLADQKSYASHLFSVCLTELPTDGESAMIIPERPVILKIPGYSNRWLKAPVPASIDLGGNTPILSKEEIEDFPLPTDFTMEGWVRPIEDGKSQERSLLAYDNDQELAFQFGVDQDSKLFARRAGFPGFQLTKTENSETVTYNQAIAQYTRDSIDSGNWNHVAVAYRSSSGINLKGKGFIDVAHSEDFNLTETFTMEGWVKVNGFLNQNLVQRWDDAKNEKSWSLSSRIYFDQDNGHKAVRKFNFKALFFDDKEATFSFNLEEPSEWAHVAVVYDSSQREMPVIDKSRGKEIKLQGEALQKRFTTFTVETWLNFPDEDNNYDGKIILSRNIPDEKKIRIRFGDEEDFEENTPEDKTLQIEVNGQFLTVDEYELPIGKLSHLAVVYHNTLDSSGERTDKATVIVYQDGILIKKVSNFKGIVPDKDSTEKWALGGDTDGDENFNGKMGELRIWEVARTEQQIVDNMTKNLAGTETGLAGLYRLTGVAIASGTKFSVLINTVDGSVTQTDEKIEGETFNVGRKVRLYLNGKLQKTCDNVTSPLKESSANLWFGKQSFDQSWDDFRIWNSPRTAGQINYYKDHVLKPVKEQIDLVAWWPMNEGKGRLITDVKSSHEGIIKGGLLYRETPEEIKDLWIPTPFGAGFTFYINGQRTPNQDDVKAEKWKAPDPLNTLIVGEKYTGRMNELRIWESQRTAQQIKGGMFHSISGKDDGLVAYYPFDTGSGELVVDVTQNGFDLDVSNPDIAWKWPTNDVNEEGLLTNPMVPVSENHPEVVELSNEVFTQQSLDTQLVVNSAPDSMEIGNQRAFAYLTQGDQRSITEVNLITDFDIGEVEMLFVGQVQFDPTLIGYIEGAPPVPGENLSVDSPSDPNKYVGSSSVKLTESDTVTHLYSGSKERGFDVSTDIKIGVTTELEDDITIPLVNKTIDITDSELTIAFRTKIDHSLGWVNETSTTESLTKTQKNQLDLSGSWTNNKYDISQIKDSQPEKLHEQPDRLYIPNNMGHALVRSKTADLFAVRLKRTGATIGYQMIPNPDIPEDFNIIMFKIKPTYVKNGSLDGRVGFDIDEDYKDIISKESNEKASFFKPEETFALQRKIEREQQELQNYFDQFDSSSKGRNVGSDFAKIDKAVLSQDEQQQRLARKNLVNTYVWTADGGLFAEEVQFSASRTETFGGTYSFSQLAGLSTEGKFPVGIGALIGPIFEIDALFGGHINTKITKSETTSVDFSLDSVATGEDFLNRIAPALVEKKELAFTEFESFKRTTDALNIGDTTVDLMMLINDSGMILSSDALSKPIVSGDRWKLIGNDTMFILKNTSKIKANTFELTQVNNGLFPVDYAASALPGKVKSYRYKTFYLAPNKDNFTKFRDIIDPEWLDSADPDAVALVQALGNTNEVWRVLHRVTFVSRVAPDPGNAFVQSEDVADQTLVQPDKDSQVSNVSVVRKFDHTDDDLKVFSKEMSETLGDLAAGESGFGTMDQNLTLSLLMKYAEALKEKDKDQDLL